MIKTERLDIVPFDMRYLRDYFDGFNGEITRYQWPDPFPDLDSAREVLQEFLEEMERGEGLLFAILSPAGKFLGSAEVHGLTGDCPELGVWIAEPVQKKGYACEALTAVLGYARAKYGKRAFFYEADVRNEASMKLLHKLESDYDVAEQALEDCVTDSGKALRLQGYILRAKIPEAQTGYIIKAMESEDEIDGKGYVHYTSWHETYTGLVDAGYIEKQTLEKCIATAHKWPEDILIAKDGEKVVGFAGYGAYRDDTLPGCGEVFALYVLAAYHGRGIGHALMNAAVEKLSAYEKIAVWVLKGNERAIRFYERYGFRFDGTEAEILLGTPNTKLRMIYVRDQA